MTAIEHLLILHNRADYISFPCGIFENGVLLMYTLDGVSSVANFITASLLLMKSLNKTETLIF